MKEIAKPPPEPCENWFEVQYPNRNVYVKYSSKERLLEYYKSLSKLNHKKMPIGVKPIAFNEKTNQISTA